MINGGRRMGKKRRTWENRPPLVRIVIVSHHFRVNEFRMNYADLGLQSFAKLSSRLMAGTRKAAQVHRRDVASIFSFFFFLCLFLHGSSRPAIASPRSLLHRDDDAFANLHKQIKANKPGERPVNKRLSYLLIMCFYKNHQLHVNQGVRFNCREIHKDLHANRFLRAVRRSIKKNTKSSDAITNEINGFVSDTDDE